MEFYFDVDSKIVLFLLFIINLFRTRSKGVSVPPTNLWSPGITIQNYQYACDREQRFADRLRIIRILLFGRRRQQQNNCTAERTHTRIYYIIITYYIVYK